MRRLLDRDRRELMGEEEIGQVLSGPDYAELSPVTPPCAQRVTALTLHPVSVAR